MKRLTCRKRICKELRYYANGYVRNEIREEFRPIYARKIVRLTNASVK